MVIGMDVMLIGMLLYMLIVVDVDISDIFIIIMIIIIFLFNFDFIFCEYFFKEILKGWLSMKDK